MPYHLATPVYGGDGGGLNPARWFRFWRYSTQLRGAEHALPFRNVSIYGGHFLPPSGLFIRSCASPNAQKPFCEEKKTMTRQPNGAWSGGRVSNPRPSDWKSDALPAELPPRWMPLWNCASAPRIRKRGFCTASGRLLGLAAYIT